MWGVKQVVTTKRPINKVSAATLAAAAVQIVVWALARFAAVEVPMEVSMALTTIAVFAVGYLVPIAPDEIAPDDA